MLRSASAITASSKTGNQQENLDRVRRGAGARGLRGEGTWGQTLEGGESASLAGSWRGGRCEPSPEASASVTPAVLVANQKLIGHERGCVQVSKGGKLSRALGETRDGQGRGSARPQSAWASG